MMTLARGPVYGQWGDVDLLGEVADPGYPWTAEAWALEIAAGAAGRGLGGWDEWIVAVDMPLSGEVTHV